MSKTRIRYKEHNGAMVSTNFFSTVKGNAYVHLYPKELRFELVDIENEGNVLDSGSAQSLHLLKKAAKDSLVKNGVVFQQEKRERLETIKEELKELGIESV